MSKILVVTYSYSGTSRLLSQMLAGMQSWTSAEVVEIHPRRGWTGLWRSVMDSLFHRRPAVRYDGPELRDYDAFVLVSPIWVYRLAGPMRSFVTAHRDALKNVSVISVMGSRGAPNAVSELGQLLGHLPSLSAAFTAREVEDGSCAGRLMAFGRAVQEAADSAVVIRPATWSPKTA